jgi:hypothetical protein
MFPISEFTSRRRMLRGIGVSLALPLLESGARTRLPAQNTAAPPAVLGALDYVCPMDPDVRSDKPGVCPRCGMTLKLGVPDLDEYELELTTTPAIIRPGQKTQLRFQFKDPKTGSPVKKFEIMHERLFHMFVVSADLQYFLHDHPVLQPDGSFLFDQVFPNAGMYRVLADVYPSAGSPQLIPKTIFVSSFSDDSPLLGDTKLKSDTALQHGANTDVELAMIPTTPVAGAKTILFFNFKKAEGMEKYLGAWAHMLIASDDTIDLMHEHPVIADGGPQMQFSFIFPRERTYRVWLQFQRSGVVNTIAVNIPVVTLEQAEGIATG